MMSMLSKKSLIKTVPNSFIFFLEITDTKVPIFIRAPPAAAIIAIAETVYRSFGALSKRDEGGMGLNGLIVKFW